MSRTVQATFDVYCELPVKPKPTPHATFDALGELPIEPKPVKTGELSQQFRDMCNDMPTTPLSPERVHYFWSLVLDAVERALPGPRRKVDRALARYDDLVAQGRSTARQHHRTLKEEAFAGICSIRCLELALQDRTKAK
jgi:hypothetical protein